MRAFCQTRLIPCEEAAPGDPQSAWGSTNTMSNINVELFDPAPIRGQDSEPIHTLEIFDAEVSWLAGTRATTVNGLKLKASYASTKGKLADSIVEDILQL